MKTARLLICMLLGAAFSGQAQDTLKTASGLRYMVLTKGHGPQPSKGQKVKVHYTGKFQNGKVFDSSKEAGPFKFTLGAKEVIPGWDEGFMLMHEGEKGILLVPSALAYGKRGVPDEDNPGKYIIPPNADLSFEVELLSVK
jgi:FKBP-type peptidyl-prolyl cis-trans isomerase